MTIQYFDFYSRSQEESQLEEQTSQNLDIHMKNKNEVMKEVQTTEATFNTGSYNTCCVHQGNKALLHRCGSSFNLDGPSQNVRAVAEDPTKLQGPTKTDIPKPNSCTESGMLRTVTTVTKPVVRPQNLCCAHVHIACSICHVLVQPRCICIVHSVYQPKVDACGENVRPMLSQHCEKGTEARPTCLRCERYKCTASNNSCCQLEQTRGVCGNPGKNSL